MITAIHSISNDGHGTIVETVTNPFRLYSLIFEIYPRLHSYSDSSYKYFEYGWCRIENLEINFDNDNSEQWIISANKLLLNHFHNFSSIPYILMNTNDSCKDFTDFIGKITGLSDHALLMLYMYYNENKDRYHEMLADLGAVYELFLESGNEDIALSSLLDIKFNNELMTCGRYVSGKRSK